MPLDLSGFLLEALTLAVLVLAGVSAAWMIGARHWLLLLSLGTLIAVSWRWVSYALLSAFGAQAWATPVWYVGAIAALVAAWVLAARLKKFVLAQAVGLAVALVSAALTRLIGLQGSFDNSSMMVRAVADYLQTEGDPERLGGLGVVNSGLAYPLMLALGPQGEALSGFAPLTFLALLAAVGWAFIRLLPRARWWLVVGLATLISAASFSAAMPWRALLYVNGYALAGLGLVLASAAAALMLREKTVRPVLLVALAVGLATVSTTRLEGVALATLVAAGFASARWLGSKNRYRWSVRLVAASALLPFAGWMMVVDGYLTRVIRFEPWEFLVVALTLSFLSGIEIFDWFRERAPHFSILLMISLIAVAFALSGESLLPGLLAQWQNLGQGAGDWGYLLLAVLPLLAIIGWRNTSREYRLLAYIALALFLATWVAAIAASLQFGSPELGSAGWDGSLNRMWLQSYAVFIVAIAVGWVQRANQGWPVARAEKVSEKSL